MSCVILLFSCCVASLVRGRAKAHDTGRFRHSSALIQTAADRGGTGKQPIPLSSVRTSIPSCQSFKTSRKTAFLLPTPKYMTSCLGSLAVLRSTAQPSFLSLPSRPILVHPMHSGSEKVLRCAPYASHLRMYISVERWERGGSGSGPAVPCR